MILSILDNDFYKFTMQNAVVKLFPRAKARYQFINRGQTKFPEGFASELRQQIDALSKLHLTPAEKTFLLERCEYLDPTYIDFLSGYQYDPAEVDVKQEGGDLQVFIEGYWYRAILWEVPLMALISELFFRMTKKQAYPEKQVVDIVYKKAKRYNDLSVKVADFGTRRRYSFENHDLIVRSLSEFGLPAFTGTSNVFLAQKYDLSPIGTHAHEWFMFHAAKFGFKMANTLALENWVNVYRGNLGIALSDTFTTDVFFEAFDKKFAKLFDGVRQDSGDPIEFANKTVAHYRRLKIAPSEKSIIFSDGLTPDKVAEIARHCRERIKMSFGIGTNFTNDVGVKPLNIVIKIIEAKAEGQNWIPTVKLSDTPGKYTGAAQTIRLAKDVLQIKD